MIGGRHPRREARAAARARNEFAAAVARGQTEIDQLVLKEGDLGEVGRRRRRAGVARRQGAQLADALIDVLRDALLEHDAHIADAARLVDLEREAARARVVVDGVEREALVAMDTRGHRAVDAHAGRARLQGGAAGDIERHVFTAKQVAHAAGDGRAQLAVDVLADADGRGAERALVGDQADIARSRHTARAQHLHRGVALDVALRIGCDRNRDGGLVPGVDLGHRGDVAARAVGGAACRQVDRAVIGREARGGVNHHLVAAGVVGVGRAIGRAGQAVGVGHRARIQLDLAAGTGVDAAQVAEHARAGVEARGRVGVIHVEVRSRLGHRNGTTRIELDLVVRRNLVARVHDKRGIARSGCQQMHLRITADPREGVLGDVGFSVARGHVDQPAGAG